MSFFPLLFCLPVFSLFLLECRFGESLSCYFSPKRNHLVLKSSLNLEDWKYINTSHYNLGLSPPRCSFVYRNLDSTSRWLNSDKRRVLRREKTSKLPVLYSAAKIGSHFEYEEDYTLPNRKNLSGYVRESFDDDEFSGYGGDYEEDPEHYELPETVRYAQSQGPDFLLTSPPWSPADDVMDPYMMKEDLRLSIDRWPENCFLRVKLFSYYKHLVNLAVDRLKLALRDNPSLKVTNPMALPMRRKRWCYLSSAFVDKRSKDLIEIQEHVRVVDVVPMKEVTNRDLKGIMMVPLPDMVSFDYWFEEVHKPVKSRMIHDLFRERRWVSKYFLYHRDKHKKKELIEKLTSPEFVDEIPLRWKRKHKEDYYFLQLGELRKLYKFVVNRKAEDEAREFYGVKTPEIWQVDDVRFIGNYEDRQYDPDYSSVDKIN